MSGRHELHLTPRWGVRTTEEDHGTLPDHVGVSFAVPRVDKVTTITKFVLCIHHLLSAYGAGDAAPW